MTEKELVSLTKKCITAFKKSELKNNNEFFTEVEILKKELRKYINMGCLDCVSRIVLLKIIILQGRYNIIPHHQFHLNINKDYNL